MKKKIISILLLAGISVSAIGFTGCQTSNDAQQSQKTQEIAKRANDAVGTPAVTNFFEKKMLKRIIEDNDNPNLITYVYTVSQVSGKFVYIGEAIGHGIPYSASFTNPEYINTDGSRSDVALPQTDPNDIYKPSNAKGTWVMLINQDTKKATPVLMEPDIITSQFKLRKEICDPSSLPSNY